MKQALLGAAIISMFLLIPAIGQAQDNAMSVDEVAVYQSVANTLPRSSTPSLWRTAESIVEEIIRTLVGSTTLVFAVPLTTALMAYVLGRWPQRVV